MGVGDEIMALGRAEKIFQETGKPVAICNELNQPRDHGAWTGNSAVDKNSSQKIIDGAGCRPYIKHWKHRQAVFNLDYRPRAGKIMLNDEEKSFNKLNGDYCVVSPHVKKTASVNKNWGAHNFEQVIKNLPMPVYQLLENNGQHIIDGAIPLYTLNFRLAASIISGAKFVLCNEGGAHHMAASMNIPAVVIFGSFTPPEVTGYNFHENISVETEEGYCGKYDACPHCQSAMKQITPDIVRNRIEKLFERMH